jgi:iron complex transport system substrate-binding protein
VTRRSLAVLAGALVVALAGCAMPAGQGTTTPEPTVADTRPLAELDLAADPRAHVGASTAVMATEEVSPVDDDPAQTLPATVVSRDPGGDREVEVADTSRVIALDMSGSIAATVWGLGLGDTLVGRDVSTTFPGAVDLPVVTSSGHAIDAESILAQRPTLIVTDGSIGPRDVLTQLREAGVDVVFVDNDPSFAGAAQLARDVAAALGVAPTGELLAARITADVEAKIAEIADYLFGEESGTDDLIRGLGGVDVAGEIGWTGLQPMTDEAIIAANPDLILVMTDGLASAGGVEGLLATKPAIALTAAGQNERFVDMADGDILSFGPRSASVLDALARAIYAP